MWVHLAELLFAASGFSTFALAVIQRRKTRDYVRRNEVLLASIDVEAERAITEIAAQERELKETAQFYSDDFARKMKACKNFITLWNSGYKSEAVQVLEEVGFQEATLQ